MRKSIVISISCALVLFGASGTAWAQDGLAEQHPAQIAKDVVLEGKIEQPVHPKGLESGKAITRLSNDQVYDLYLRANRNARNASYNLTGILVPTGDVESLARAMKRLAGDPDLRASMGTAGAGRVRSEFSIDRHVDRMEAVLGAER